MCNFVFLDAGRRSLCRFSQNNAGLPYARHVQTEHGGIGSVHVSTGKFSGRTVTGPESAFPIAKLPHIDVRLELVFNVVHHRPQFTIGVPNYGRFPVRRNGNHFQGGTVYAHFGQRRFNVARYGGNAEGINLLNVYKTISTNNNLNNSISKKNYQPKRKRIRKVSCRWRTA